MIVIPMAGYGSRFKEAGYDEPKYSLDLNGETIFHHVLFGFKKYFDTQEFVFIARQEQGAKDFLRVEAERLGLKHWSLKELNAPTSGQAETVLFGIRDYSGEEPLHIFNIDTIRFDITLPDFRDSGPKGFLEVFKGDGDQWSFVESGPSNSVIRTVEKVRISDLCSTGLYSFRTIDDFVDSYRSLSQQTSNDFGECYVAPLFNYLIASGSRVEYFEVMIDDIGFSGTPEEYCDLIKRNDPRLNLVIETKNKCERSYS